MQKRFEMCKVKIELSAQAPLDFTGDAAIFEKDFEMPDLHILCKSTDIPVPEGQLLGEGNERKAYFNNGILTRYLFTNEEPYAAIEYDPLNLKQATLLVREKDWPWATDSLRFWITACLPVLLLYFRTLVFHASYVKYKGNGILFTAPSGTGKSTQAALWKEHRGANILNGDKAAVSLQETVLAHGIPFSGTSGICKDESVPLKAIVVLSQAEKNTAYRMSPIEAVAALCPNIFADKVVPNEWTKMLNLLVDLVSNIPVYSLACTPDKRAVEALEQCMEI